MHLRYTAAAAVLVAGLIGYVLWRLAHPQRHSLADLWLALRRYVVGLAVMAAIGAAYVLSHGGVSALAPAASAISNGQIISEQHVSEAAGWVRTDAGFRTTSDGGQTWHSPAWPVGGDPIFTDPADGWIRGQTGWQRTVDGGLTWSKVALPGGPYSEVGTPHFTDAAHGTVVAMPISKAGAEILSTTDGGTTWADRSMALPAQGLSPGYVQMFDGLHGLVDVPGSVFQPGPPAALYRTLDGGRTWQPAPLPSSPSGLAAGAAEAMIIRGGPTTSLFGAFDAVTWRVYGGPGANPTYATAFYVTYDAGLTWAQAGSVTPSGAVDIISASHWLAASGSPAAATLQQTADGGKTWSPLPSSNLTTPVYWLDFPFDDGNGWAGVGRSQLVCLGMGGCGAAGLEATADGGKTWTPLTP